MNTETDTVREESKEKEQERSDLALKWAQYKLGNMNFHEQRDTLESLLFLECFGTMDLEQLRFAVENGYEQGDEEE
jgi:hypothetical protein